jgi:hypothetical protein
MEHLDSYLAADEIDLPGDLLDRMDQIVPPSHDQRRRQHVELHASAHCGIPPPVEQPPQS